MPIDLDRLMQEARAELRRSGDLLPRLVIETQHGPELHIVIASMPHSADARHALLLLLGYDVAAGAFEDVPRQRAERGIEPIDVALAVDTWFATDDLTVAPSSRPDRREAILVASRLRRGPTTVRLQPYRRVRSRIVFEKEPFADGQDDVGAQDLLLSAFWTGVEAYGERSEPHVRTLLALARLMVAQGPAPAEEGDA